jgi:hypothetical protein
MVLHNSNWSGGEYSDAENREYFFKSLSDNTFPTRQNEKPKAGSNEASKDESILPDTAGDGNDVRKTDL